MKKYVKIWLLTTIALLATMLSITAHAHKASTNTVATPYFVKDSIERLINTNFVDDEILDRSLRPEFYRPNQMIDTGTAIDSIEALITKHKEISGASNSSTLSLDPSVKPKLFQTGTASWYGPRFYGRKTASGEVFTKQGLTAAHRTLPFGTKIRVTNERTGKSVVVKVNDRGPFSGNRVLDLSHAAASAIGMIDSGLCKVRIEKL